MTRTSGLSHREHSQCKTDHPEWSVTLRRWEGKNGRGRAGARAGRKERRACFNKMGGEVNYVVDKFFASSSRYLLRSSSFLSFPSPVSHNNLLSYALPLSSPILSLRRLYSSFLPPFMTHLDSRRGIAKASRGYQTRGPVPPNQGGACPGVEEVRDLRENERGDNSRDHRSNFE